MEVLFFVIIFDGSQRGFVGIRLGFGLGLGQVCEFYTWHVITIMTAREAAFSEAGAFFFSKGFL